MSAWVVSGHKEIDLTSSHNGSAQPCDACGIGHAKVVYYKKNKISDRWFFGCSYSTEENPCKGPRTWNSIDVPSYLRTFPAGEGGKSETKKLPSGSKRERNRCLEADAPPTVSESTKSRKTDKLAMLVEKSPNSLSDSKSESGGPVRIKKESDWGRNAGKRKDY